MEFRQQASVRTGWGASPTLRRAVTRSLLALSIGAWSGAFCVLAEAYILSAVFFLFVPVYFLQQLAVSRQLQIEPGLTEEQRERYLSQVRGYGPAGVVQLAIRIYFPSSQLGGS